MEEYEKEALRKVLDYLAFQTNLSAEVADAITILETWEYSDRKGFNNINQN